jgi:hypothetical protein
MYCDGAITQQRTARDIIEELLFTCRGTQDKGNDEEWDLAIDGTKSSEGTFGDNDNYYDNCSVLSVSCIAANEALKSATVNYDLQSGNPYTMSITGINTNFGIDKVYELSFVKETNTAKKVLSYLKNRATYADKKVRLITDLDGRSLRRGAVITLTCAARGISAATYTIERISRGLTEFELECRQYSSSIFGDEVITSPTAGAIATISTAGPQSLVTSEFAVEDVGVFAADKKVKIRIDGVLYYISLDAA